MSEAVNLAVPFFSQRSARYIDGEGKSYAHGLCNITSVCMALHYLGITDDTPDEMLEKFLAKGYEGTNAHEPYELWSNLKRCCIDLYNVDKELLLYGEKGANDQSFCFAKLGRYLQAGLPVVFSFGILKPNTAEANESGNGEAGRDEKEKKGENKSGHIALLRGMTEEGHWIVNDPWGDPANPWGLLEAEKKVVAGIYVARDRYSGAAAGKGSGDNAIISRNEMARVCSDPPYAALCVLWARQWCFFLRDGGGERIRYGDESGEETTAKAQDELGGDLSFILGGNGAIKRGIDFSAAAGKKVYSCGPGRIIAIRNTKKASTNFILVMHELPKEGRKKVFMLYRGLAYVDLNAEIKKKLYVSEDYAAAWYDQLIRKIHGKAVIFDKGEESAGRVHESGLAERGIAYLIPYEEGEFKDFLENIKAGEGATKEGCVQVDNIDMYRSADKKKIKIYINGREEITDGLELIGQGVNIHEYQYYREKISRLLSGEAAVFTGEDKDTIGDLSKAMKDDFKTFFYNAVKDVFYDIDTGGEEGEYEKRLERVAAYYENKIDMLEGEGKKEDAEAAFKEFRERCENLCQKLLETPWRMQKHAFSLSDNWFNGGEKFKGMKDVYEQIYEAFEGVKGGHDFETTWKLFEEKVSYFYPANMDFYLEASSATVLGEATGFSCVECFSLEDIRGEHPSLNMKVIGIENQYNKAKTVSILKEEGYITEDDLTEIFAYGDEDYIREEETEAFHKRYPLKDFEYALRIRSPFERKKEMLDEAYGYVEINEERRKGLEIKALLSDELEEVVKKECGIDLSAERVYFYNPVKMVSCLFEMHKETVDALGRRI